MCTKHIPPARKNWLSRRTYEQTLNKKSSKKYALRMFRKGARTKQSLGAKFMVIAQ